MSAKATLVYTIGLALAVWVALGGVTGLAAAPVSLAIFLLAYAAGRMDAGEDAS